MNLGPYRTGPNDTPENGIYTGDARRLSAAIPDESVDLIFTDLPYLREYIPLYGWLAQEAARVLKPDGFMLAYTGTYHLDATMAQMREHMEYFWDFVSFGSGYGAMNWQRKIISRHKAILAYRKRGSSAMPRMNTISVWVGGGQDKRFHVWGQDESTARYYIDCFVGPGAVVYDPLCGGGTTAAMCKVLGLRYLAFEVVPETAAVARDRVAAQQMPLLELAHRQLEMEMEHGLEHGPQTGALAAQADLVPTGALSGVWSAGAGELADSALEGRL